MIEKTRAAAAAIESGDVAKVCEFLQQLFPVGARREGSQLKCMRRVLSLFDTRWKAEVDRKRKATFSSEDKGVVDAVLMGGYYLPSDTFANVVGYLDHATAIRSTPSSRSWWRMISGLPAASHVDTSLGKGIGWAGVLTQLKNMRASNPLRSVSRLTLGHGRVQVKLGSFAKLAQAAGGPEVLTHLDLTGTKRGRNINFVTLAEALPNLKGLAVEDWFFTSDNVRMWLRQLTRFVHTVKLESLRIKVEDFSGAKSVSPITDRVLADLAYGPCGFLQYHDEDVVRDRGGDGPSTLRKLWIDVPAAGPIITDGMAAIGANMPHLEELVVDKVKVSDDGWRKFATARADAAATPSSNNGNSNGNGSSAGDRDRDHLLHRIRIRTNGTASVPSAATRCLLEDTVSESVALYLDHRCLGATTAGTAAGSGGSGGGGSDVSGDGQYVDCEGALIELSPNHKENDPNGKIRVLRSFLWCARMGGVGWMTM